MSDDYHSSMKGREYEDSHHLFRKVGVKEKPNLQKEGNKAKPYQVKQIRNIILKYKMGVSDDK
ncbi:MAG: hypothetical protein U5L00_04260 [Desulfovermiculus sp.]|nr:hypothetical protein [Desulfovermiculus sp.]